MTRCVIVRVYYRLELLVSRPGLTQLAGETGRMVLVLAHIAQSLATSGARACT